jgi:hypothetical protein
VPSCPQGLDLRGLKQICRIEKVGVHWVQHNHTFSVSLSTNGTSWTTVVPSRQSATNAYPEGLSFDDGSYHGSDPIHEVFPIPPTDAKYLRLDITATSAPGSHIFKARVDELEAYAAAEAAHHTPLEGEPPTQDMQRVLARISSLRQDRSWSTIREEVTAWMANHPQQAVAMRVSATPKIAMRSDPQSVQTAEYVLREALAFGPNSTDVLRFLAMIVMDTERHTEAIELNRRVLEKTPDDTVVLNNLAWILAEHQQDYEQALVLTTKAVALAPDFADLLNTHGLVCFHLRRFRKLSSRMRQFLLQIKLYWIVCFGASLGGLIQTAWGGNAASGGLRTKRLGDRW